MNNVLKLGKKVFTVGVVLTTILWSVGVAALVPGVANAATCPVLTAGTVVKVGTIPTLYVIGNDLKLVSGIDNQVVTVAGKKKYFSAFKSWGTTDSYGTIVNITAECYQTLGMSSQAFGWRAGATLLKHPVSGALIVVLPNRAYAKISLEAAKALYGYTATMTLPTFSTNDLLYSLSGGEKTMVTEAKAHDGMLVSKAGKTYLVDGSTLREVTAAGMTANGYKASHVHMVGDAAVAGYTMGATIDALVAALTDKTQSGGAVAGTTPPVAGGDLMVSLAADTPAGTNIADGTSFNPVLKVNLKAGDKAVTVKGLTLKKGGYLLNAYITGIDVVDSSLVRHGNVVSSVNTDNEVVVIFGSNPVNVAANTSVTLTVRINLSGSSSASTVKLGVSKVDSTATSVTGLTVFGNEFSVVDGANAVASTTFDVLPVNTSGVNMTPDDVNSQEVTKFRVSEVGSKEDILLNKLTLFNYGNAADADYKDIQLVTNDGTVLATAQPAGQYVTFDLVAPYKISKGQYKDLTVRMKIVNGTTKTIQLVAYNDYDVVVKGSETGYSVIPAAGTNDTSFPVGDASNYNKVTIQAGTMSFGKNSDSPNTAVAPGATNVVLAKYYAKAVGEDMELRKVSFGVIQDDSALTSNIYVKVDGATVWSGAASSFAVAGTVVSSFAINTYPVLKAGVNSYITVEANVPSTATSGVYYQVNNFDLTEVKKVISNTIADPLVAEADGNVIQVSAATLTAKTLSLPVARTIVAGTPGLEVARFEFDAQSSGEDTRVSSIVVSNMGTGSVTSSVGNLVLKNGTEPITTSNSTVTGAASTTFTFNNAINITKGAKITLSLYADALTYVAGDHKFVLHSVTATGKDTGTTVSVTPTGSGQAMTMAESGTLTLTLNSGTNASPASTQLVNVGTQGGTYLSFNLLASNEDLKLRSLKLTASSTLGTTLRANTLRNVGLYLNDATTPFATTDEMTCSSGLCTYTWTAADNILPSNVTVGSNVKVTVKANIGGQAEAKLGDNFIFSIASSTADVSAVGATTGNTATVSGAPTATGYTYVNPFAVTVEGVTPSSGSSITQTIGSGTVLGRFKVMNNGTAQISLTEATLTDSGTNSTTSEAYALYYSGENSSDYTNTTVTSTQSSVDFGTLATPITINGGSYRYLTVSVQAATGLASGDSFNLSVAALGNLLFSVTDANLGWDGNVDGDLTLDTNTGLYVSGTPTLGTLNKQ